VWVDGWVLGALLDLSDVRGGLCQVAPECFGALCYPDFFSQTAYIKLYLSKTPPTPCDHLLVKAPYCSYEFDGPNTFGWPRLSNTAAKYVVAYRAEGRPDNSRAQIDKRTCMKSVGKGGKNGIWVGFDVPERQVVFLIKKMSSLKANAAEEKAHRTVFSFYVERSYVDQLREEAKGQSVATWLGTSSQTGDEGQAFDQFFIGVNQWSKLLGSSDLCTFRRFDYFKAGKKMLALANSNIAFSQKVGVDDPSEKFRLPSEYIGHRIYQFRTAANFDYFQIQPSKPIVDTGRVLSLEKIPIKNEADWLARYPKNYLAGTQFGFGGLSPWTSIYKPENIPVDLSPGTFRSDMLYVKLLWMLDNCITNGGDLYLDSFDPMNLNSGWVQDLSAICKHLKK